MDGPPRLAEFHLAGHDVLLETVLPLAIEADFPAIDPLGPEAALFPEPREDETARLAFVKPARVIENPFAVRTEDAETQAVVRLYPEYLHLQDQRLHSA